MRDMFDKHFPTYICGRRKWFSLHQIVFSIKYLPSSKNLRSEVRSLLVQTFVRQSERAKRRQRQKFSMCEVFRDVNQTNLRTLNNCLGGELLLVDTPPQSIVRRKRKSCVRLPRRITWKILVNSSHFARFRRRFHHRGFVPWLLRNGCSSTHLCTWRYFRGRFHNFVVNLFLINKFHL